MGVLPHMGVLPRPTLSLEERVDSYPEEEEQQRIPKKNLIVNRHIK